MLALSILLRINGDICNGKCQKSNINFGRVDFFHTPLVICSTCKGGIVNNYHLSNCLCMNDLAQKIMNRRSWFLDCLSVDAVDGIKNRAFSLALAI